MKTKLITGLISVALAFALWLYVVNVVNPEFEASFSNVQVTLEGEGLLEERGLMITANNNETVNLRLKGNRTYLVELNSENIGVIADVSKITRAGTHHLIFEEMFPGNIPDNAIEVQTKNPDTITVVVEDRITKTVDIVVDYGKTNVPEGFICDKEGIAFGDSGDTVSVTGPRSVVEKIAQAVVYIDLTEQRESIIDKAFAFTLCDSDNVPVDVTFVKTNISEADVTLKIQRYKDITLAVDVIYGGGATEKTSSVTINPEMIRISGNEMMLAKIEDTMVLGSIDLSKLLEDTQIIFPITLPETVTNESNVTEAVVDVKFLDLKTKTLTVYNIMPINVPAGLNVDMSTKQLEIKVRGPAALVDEITAEHIAVTVDFAEAERGTATMRADVSVNSEFVDVGVVGSYSITASLKKYR